ncbi:MAG: gamma-glutamyltransferase [Alphaproteobacteria bacterium]|nr:gamma-glutamyltransferase [Alphaproteobacteria bacterium]
MHERNPSRRRPRPLVALGLAFSSLVGLIASGVSAAPATATRQMIAAADPRAAQAGLDTLRAGGSAVDAAIAAALVLALVEPQSSGIGGGAFLLHFDARSKEINAYDGRETAPAAATADMFVNPDGKSKSFFDAVVGGLSVGTPGLLRLFELVHAKHGRLPWDRLFVAAIALAEGGFVVSPRLESSIVADKALPTFADTRLYFFTPDGLPRKAGTRLSNQPLADVLAYVARDGANAFYSGAIAADIVSAVATAPRNPGRLAYSDLTTYRAIAREPVCGSYRTYRVCGMPPPSSGGIAVLQILRLLERFEINRLPPSSIESVHLIAEAHRLAFADRARFLGDPDVVPVPVAELLDPVYLQGRSALIQPRRSLGRASAGVLPERRGELFAPAEAGEIPSTSHLSVIDADGNAVAMTASIEGGFGAKLMVRGFLLNNQLTDFAFQAAEGDRTVANAVGPRKRPLSSMAPTLVFDNQGRLRLAAGSQGGSRIIPFVTKLTIGVLDWNLDVQAAIDLPHFVNRNGATELEADTPIAVLKGGLEALGHEVTVHAIDSGQQGLAVTPSGIEGGADRRREGVAVGD